MTEASTDATGGAESGGSGAGAHAAGRPRRPSGAAMRFDASEPVTIVLLRHGETEMTRDKALSGSGVPGPALARTGRIQAARAADVVFRIGRSLWPDVPHPSALVASPMVRTQETAAAVGRRLGLHVRTDASFAEADFGRWEGVSVAELDRSSAPDGLRRWYEDPSFAAPDGESLADVGRRVEAGLRVIMDGGTGRTVVVVSHVMAVRAAVGLSLAMPDRSWPWLRILPASVSVVRWWPDGMREAVVVGMPTDT